MEPVSIRPAELDDAPAIAEIHVRAWQGAYRGQIPDEILDGLSVEHREQGWRRQLSELRTAGFSHRIWVADRDGKVVGFASSGPSHDQDAPPSIAEIYAIYLLPEAIGSGLGRRLFGHAVEEIRRQGFTAATLWVLGTNAGARRFYERAGWSINGGVKTEDFHGYPLREVRYRIDLAAFPLG